MLNKLARVPKVLVVSNQQTTGPLWVFSLQQQKLNVVLEVDPSNAIQCWEKEVPDIIILDVNLSSTATLDLIKSLRMETIIPILLLSSATSMEDVLEAYKAGVDDCLLKPVDPSLFLAKTRVWLHRAWNFPASTLESLKVGGMHLFPSERVIVMKNGQTIHLTSLELRFLYCLMSQPGHILTIEDLNQRIWGYAAETDTTMLKNVVYRLRRKIEADPANPLIIQTVVGRGYKLAAE